MISYAQNMVDFFHQSSQFYFTIIDPDGKFAYVNPHFAKKFSFLHSDFIGIPAAIIIYPDDLPKFRQALDASLACVGSPVLVDVRHPSSNGHLYLTRFELTSVAGNDGKLAGIHAIGTDLTVKAETSNKELELRELSAELKQANRELNEILQNASEAIFKLDLEGNIIYMTPEFTRLTGYDENDVYAKHWGEFIHPDDLDICYDAMSAAVLHRITMRNICYRFRQKDNGYHWYSTSATLVTDDAGQPLYVICLSRDVTERKYVEDALQASEERYKVFIEQSSEAICRFEFEVQVEADLPEDEILSYVRNYS